MNKSDNSRIYKNLGALGSGLVLNILIQILSIPIFLHYLSIEEYSNWLVASNLTQIYILADLGTLTSLQNRIVFFLRKGVQNSLAKDVKTVFSILSIGFSVLFTLVVLFLSLTDFNLQFSTFLIFTFSSFLSSHYSIHEGLARGFDETHLGLYQSGLLRLVEFVGYLLSMFFGFSTLFEIAIIGFGFKLLTWIALIFAGNKRYEFSTLSFKLDSNFRQIIREGSPFLLIRIADLFSNGLLIVGLSHYISPLSLVLFSALKTFFRIGLQFITTINYAFSYEITESWALSNFRFMNIAIKTSAKVAFVVAGFASLAYLSFGSTLFEMWTHNRFFTKETVFYIGALYSFTSSVSQTQKVKFNATNSNKTVAIISIIFAFLNFSILANIPDSGYPNYPFILLIITDIVGVVAVYISSRTKFEDEYK